MDYLSGLQWVAQNYGLYAAMVVFFLGRDTYRDYRQSLVITSLQKEMRDIVFPMVNQNAQVIAQNTVAIERNSDALTETTQMIEKCTPVMEHLCNLAITNLGSS